MAARFPNADHLTNEEVQYELKLRGKTKEAGSDLKSQHRLLRLLFKQDGQEGNRYEPPFTFEQEIDIVQSRVYPLLDSLKKRADARIASRLWHYYHRIGRTKPGDDKGKMLKREILEEMEVVLLGPTGEASNTLLDQSEHEEGTGLSEPGEGAENLERKTGTKPRSQIQPPESKPSYQDLERRVIELESLVQRLSSNGNGQNTITRESLVQSRVRSKISDGSDTEQTVKEVRRIQVHPTPKFQEADVDTDPDDPRLPRNRSLHQRFTNSSRYSEDDYPTSLEGERRFQRGSRHARRIEHWKVSFSGDNRTLPVEDFLFKLKKIASREGIPKSELLKDIHLVLEGKASDWFFTYIDSFQNWYQFEEKLRYRFGNPNQDKGIRLKMHERKQQRGESFMAFLTDIDRLSNMLSVPMSRRQKFEIVWDNMRQHYRSKISIIKVQNLDHLIELNHGIDSEDLVLQSSTEPRNSRPVYNVEYGHSDYSDHSDSDGRQIDAVEARQGDRYPRTVRNKPDGNQNQESYRPRSNEQIQSPEQDICWNCRRKGHNWRKCNEPRIIFCFGCGEIGRTIRSCEKCPSRERRPFRMERGNRERNA